MEDSCKAVFFDAGKTLLRAQPSVAEIYEDTARKYGLPVEPGMMKSVFSHEWKRSTMVDDLKKTGMPATPQEEKRWWKGFVGRVFGHFEKTSDFDLLFEALYERFALPESWQLYPDVKPCLEYCRRKGIVMAVVSNWDSRLIDLLKGHNIRHYFDRVVISSQVGYEKPDLRIYRYALEALNLEPHCTIHVGDDPDLDVTASRNAGITGILLNRTGCVPGYEPAIGSLSELPAFL
jgi:putative hydrolase of the HAD superfamily